MKHFSIKRIGLFVFTFLLLGAGNLIAQRTITGTVNDPAEGETLIGANVVVKGTSIGTITDFDGTYSIDIPADATTLEFSYTGYTTQEVVLGASNIVNVDLSAGELLDEIVVIGYGTTTVKDATGSVSAVTSKDFNGGVISSPEQLIQGKTAGVQITQGTGQPGGGIAIRIRGTTSVRSNNNPLFVVDGVPLGGDATSASGSDIGFGSSGATNPLSFINPSDIESISILKDASSTAIYGSRGANGVVIITTKSGRGSPGGVFEYSGTVSSSKAANTYDLLDREQFLAAVTQFGGDAAAQDFGANTDWQDVVLRNSISYDNSLSYSHNYTGGSLRATVGYGVENGVLENSSLEKITARINARHKFLDDKLSLKLGSTYSTNFDEAPGLSAAAGFQGDLLGAAYSANPTWPNDPDFDAGGQRNPRNYLDYVGSFTRTNRVLLDLSADYKIMPELSAKISFGYDKSNSDRTLAANALSRNIGDNTFGNGDAAFTEVNLENSLMEFTVNYSKELNNSNLSALVGYSFQDFDNSGRNVRGNGFSTTDLEQMGDDLEMSADIIEGSFEGSFQQYGSAPNGFFINRLLPNPATETGTAPGGLLVNSIATESNDFTDELQSYFARVNYTIADKYLFTATIRADGSSRFGSENQYGYFPSGAFAWKINEEDFMGNAFSTLKLRLGAGITGNQDGLGYGNFIRRERYAGIDLESNGNIETPGLAPVSFANPGLKWEETTSYGVGLDFGFGNDRFTGSIDVYKKETKDLLLVVQAAQPSPQPTFFQNLDATVSNQGIEFALDYDIIQSNDLQWNANFNISYNDNELQDFGGLIPAGTIRGQGLSQAFSQILAENQPLFSFFLREFEGFDESGQPIGDVQTFVGKSALPDINTGLSTSVRYKNWDASAYFAGQFGHYVYNNTRNAFFTAGAIANARNVTPDVLTSGEAGNAEAAVSTRFLEKGDFVRLQNISLGYNLPLKSESVFSSLRLYVNGQNLFVITDYSGLDPEVSTAPASADLLNSLPTAGIDYTGYPRPRTFTFGVNAKF